MMQSEIENTETTLLKCWLYECRREFCLGLDAYAVPHNATVHHEMESARLRNIAITRNTLNARPVRGIAFQFYSTPWLLYNAA